MYKDANTAAIQGARYLRAHSTRGSEDGTLATERLNGDGTLGTERLGRNAEDGAFEWE